MRAGELFRDPDLVEPTGVDGELQQDDAVFGPEGVADRLERSPTPEPELVLVTRRRVRDVVAVHVHALERRPGHLDETAAAARLRGQTHGTGARLAHRRQDGERAATLLLG